MSAPARDPQYRTADAAATLGNAMKVVGRIESNEDLIIEGQVEGEVHVPGHRLTVGPHGSVHANIKALEIISHGTVHGDMEATGRIELRKASNYKGDLRTARLMVEDGANLNGSIEMTTGRDGTTRDEPLDFDSLGHSRA